MGKEQRKNLGSFVKKTLFFIFLTLVVGACSTNIGEKNHIALNGKNGEADTVTTHFSASNKTLKLANSKPFVLFFISTNCGACDEAVPYMNYFEEKYADRFEVIGVMNGGLRFDEGLAVLKKKNIDFKVITEIKSVDYLSRAVGGIYGTPVFYIYDKDGILKKKFLGLTPQSKLEESIRNIIQA
ncbi:MAG: TlpA family protein disulfide reductase [Campylobacteraceae bacterium]|jgi:thiol-disulfide isomerase/thioredoxin|nr:TlpA family protein disulfide reductase [Campylobacteraceae bacterium]